MQILEMFLVSLILTLMIETAVALLFGVRIPGLKVVWLANVLTNPPAVCMNWMLKLWFPALPLLMRQLPIEALAVLVEAAVYHYFADEERWWIRRPVALAVTANLVSYCSGLLLR